MKITLTNNFHNTAATIRPTVIGESFIGINRATVNRVRRDLCGCAGCTCGDTIGARGGIKLDLIEIDRNGLYVFERGI